MHEVPVDITGPATLVAVMIKSVPCAGKGAHLTYAIVKQQLLRQSQAGDIHIAVGTEQ